MGVKDFMSKITGKGKRFGGPRNYAQGAPEYPDQRDPLLNIPLWDDPVYTLNPTGYQLIRTTMGTAFPLVKIGMRLAALDLVAVGDVNSERRKAYQYILDHAIAMSDVMRDLVWGFPEGYIAAHMKPSASPSGGPVFIVPDFRNSIVRKDTAGGPLKYDGEKLYRKRQTNPQVASEDQQEAVLPREEFLLFRPGAGSSPQGDPWFGLVMLELAQELQENRLNTNAYRKRHGKVYHLLEKKLGRAQAAERKTLLQNIVNETWKQSSDRDTLSASDMSGLPTTDANRTNQFFGIPAGDVMKLIEPSGQTWQFLLEDRREVRAEAHMFALGQLLTSDSRDSGATGSSMVQLSAEDKFLSGYAQSMEVPFNHDLKDWIDRRNTMPILMDGEEEIFFEFRSRGRRPEDLAELGGDFTEVADEIDSVDDALGNSTGGSTEGANDEIPDI